MPESRHSPASTADDAATLTVHDLVEWMQRFDDVTHRYVDWLTQLDTAIGDADHGINLVKGTAAVRRDLSDDRPSDAGDLLNRCGMAFLATIGGASGALYGKLFIEMGREVGSAGRIDVSLLAAAFEAGLAGVVAIGRAEQGDKTMVDALTPAISALTAAATMGAPLHEALGSASVAARNGRDATLPLVAQKGRASYLGKRSADHLDPGAASAALLFHALTSITQHSHGQHALTNPH